MQRGASLTIPNHQIGAWLEKSKYNGESLTNRGVGTCFDQFSRHIFLTVSGRHGERRDLVHVFSVNVSRGADEHGHARLRASCGGDMKSASPARIFDVDGGRRRWFVPRHSRAAFEFQNAFLSAVKHGLHELWAAYSGCYVQRCCASAVNLCRKIHPVRTLVATG